MTNKIKKKHIINVGIADQLKQGRDDSIKQFSIQPYPTYLSTLRISI